MTNIKKKKYMPSAFIIIIVLMIIFIVISWIGKISNSSTDVFVKENVIVNGEIKKVVTKVEKEIQGLGILDIFISIWEGLKARIEIISFLFSMNILLLIVAKTKSLDIAIKKLIIKLKGKEILIIPVLMILLGLGGTSFGLWEETLPFFAILMPVFLKMGFGPMSAVMTILLGAGSGVLASTVNPFAVGLGYEAAESVASGTKFPQSIFMGTRWIAFIVYQIIAIAFVLFITIKYKKNPVNDPLLNLEIIKKKFPLSSTNDKFDIKKKITIGLFVFAFVIMIISFLPWKSWISSNSLENAHSSWNKGGFWIASNSSWSQWGNWGFLTISALFFLLAFITFIINRKELKENGMNSEQTFIHLSLEGMKEVFSVCMLIAVAAGFGFLLKASHVGPWIANSFTFLGKLGLVGYGILIFIVSIFLSILIPSTSGFASAFIPIFSGIVFASFPKNLHDAGIGITILAFIFASGIANLFTPTSAALMAYTAYAEIPYSVWLKKIFPVIIVQIIIAIIIISITAVMANNNIMI